MSPDVGCTRFELPINQPSPGDLLVIMNLSFREEVGMKDLNCRSTNVVTGLGEIMQTMFEG